MHITLSVIVCRQRFIKEKPQSKMEAAGITIGRKFEASLMLSLIIAVWSHCLFDKYDCSWPVMNLPTYINQTERKA